MIRLQLISSNLSKAISENIIRAEPEVFLHLKDEEQRRRIFEGVEARALAARGDHLADEIRREHEEAWPQLGYHHIKESVDVAAERIRDNLSKIMQMINDQVLAAAFFGGANDLRDIRGSNAPHLAVSSAARPGYRCKSPGAAIPVSFDGHSGSRLVSFSTAVSFSPFSRSLVYLDPRFLRRLNPGS